MEETREIRKLFHFLQGLVYTTLVLEILAFCLSGKPLPMMATLFLEKLHTLPVYQELVYSKAFTLVLLLVVSIGTKPKKKVDLPVYRRIFIPLFLGLGLVGGSMWVYSHAHQGRIMYVFTFGELMYMAMSLLGTMLIHTGLDNISKHVHFQWQKDRFNVENESFAQSGQKDNNAYSVNLPMHYYFHKRNRRGWLNIVNPFRGTLLIGTPGSGKTYSIILPFIRQHLRKGFSMVVYDFKYPDLTGAAFHHYKKNLKNRTLPNFRFHVLNLNELEKSRRVNPLRADYIPSLAAAAETAEALIESLRKTAKSYGTDQFFSQSAINFLSATIYYFSRVKAGKYSTLAHVLAFINHSYVEIFHTLYRQPELHSLLSPFQSAYEQKAFDQLEGQIGTLRINLSRLATLETFWVFSGDDFPLQVSHPDSPAVLVIANTPETQQINNACYSLVINRLVKLLNRQGNLPCSLIIDEVPTLYIHRMENLLATARSNKVSILLGLQELPQFRQQYGKEAADTICAIPGNILSGAVRHTDTLVWLEKLLGRIRQLRKGVNVDRNRTSISMNEYMDHLIPAAKIANLQAGELVGKVAADYRDGDHPYEHHSYHCRVAVRDGEEPDHISQPRYYDFGGEKETILKQNMERIRREVEAVVHHG